MPQMGVSVSEGTITKWLKQEGETVEADEPLLEISTDKVDTEVPSPGAGVVQQIFVQEGETVEVGTRLAVIAPEGSAPVEAPSEPEPQAAPEPEPMPEPVPQAEAPAPAPEAAPAVAQPSGNGKFVSPVVARIASEHGVDPGQVPGTGAGGRVTKKDILAFIESGAQAAPAAPAEAPTEAPAAPSPAAEPPPSPAPPQPAAVAQPEAAGGETLEPMTAMRKGIAEHMRRSLD